MAASCYAGDDIPFREIHRGMAHIDTAVDPTGFDRVSLQDVGSLTPEKAKGLLGKALYRCSVYYSGMAVHRLYLENDVLIVEVNQRARPHFHPPAPPKGKKYRYDIYVALNPSVAFKKARVKYVTVTPGGK
jgi:hypothetical protein